MTNTKTVSKTKSLSAFGMVLFFCLFLTGCNLNATIQGKITDIATQRGISNALVEIIQGTKSFQCRTDSNGNYKITLTLQTGICTVKASNTAYQTFSNTITLVSNQTTYTVNLSLTSTSNPTDTTPPTGNININNNAIYSTSTTVTLGLSALDSGSGMGTGAQMKFSNDNTNWSNPESFAPIKTWVMTTGEGTKTVYVKFKDVAGNWSSIISDTIILDSIKPQVAITVPQDGAIVK